MTDSDVRDLDMREPDVRVSDVMEPDARESDGIELHVRIAGCYGARRDGSRFKRARYEEV